MENNIEKLKKSKKALIILLILIIAVVSISLVGYSRYISKTDGQATADIAKLSFKVNEKTNEVFVIDLGQTRAVVEQQANVQNGYVGPGTAGKFQIIIDATGSETSIGYDINMNVDKGNNDKFPENLIFYSDEAMTNAIYTSDSVINISGYIAYADSSKVKTHNIYWKWDYEVGQTQDDIDDNDELDSIWMGKNVSLSINVLGRQVTENPQENQCMVTFDANGGILEGYGNSEKATKIVTLGEQYGELPIPKKEGYTFVGWIGNNILDYNELMDNAKISGIVVNADGYVSDNTPYEDHRGWHYEESNWVMSVEPGIYKIQLYFLKQCTNTDYGQMAIVAEDGKWLGGTRNNMVYKDELSYSFSVLETSNIGILIKSYDGVYRIKLEKNSTSTEWEPYQLTTPESYVIINNNHTIMAKWIKE